jgi:hypothetical protein
MLLLLLLLLLLPLVSSNPHRKFQIALDTRSRAGRAARVAARLYPAGGETELPSLLQQNTPARCARLPSVSQHSKFCAHKILEVEHKTRQTSVVSPQPSASLLIFFAPLRLCIDTSANQSPAIICSQDSHQEQVKLPDV